MDNTLDRLWPKGIPPAPALCGEDERAAVLASYGLDALDDDPSLAEIAQFAARLCQTPYAMVTVVERERQRFLARIGLEERETPRSTSFCAHAMLGSEPLEIPDAREDERFAHNPLVTGSPHIRFYAGAPLVSEEGAPLGALCVIDTEPRGDGLTELQREGLGVLARAATVRLGCHRTARGIERDRELREEHIRFLADTMPDIAFSTDADGMVRYYNRRWFEITGLADDSELNRRGDLLHPDDKDTAISGWNDAREAGRPFSGESRLRCADGSYRWMLIRTVPFADGDGKIIRWFGTMTDIDAGHRLSESRDLLARELSHRIKNIFAVVSGLVSMRARKRPEAAEFANEIGETLRALGQAHDYVRQGDDGDSNTLAGLLRRLLAPYGESDSGRIAISGGDCQVGPRAATPLALVIHELATNAAKYGALSTDAGQVAIAIEAGDDTVTISWREKGGPAPVGEAKEGFGSRLVRMAIEGQLDGNIARDWETEGLAVTIRVKRDTIAT